MFAYVHVCIIVYHNRHMFAYVHVCIIVYHNRHVFAYVHVCMYVCVCMHAYMYTLACTRTAPTNTYRPTYLFLWDFRGFYTPHLDAQASLDHYVCTYVHICVYTQHKYNIHIHASIACIHTGTRTLTGTHTFSFVIFKKSSRSIRVKSHLIIVFESQRQGLNHACLLCLTAAKTVPTYVRISMHRQLHTLMHP
jgi:hypothetical protein